MNHMVLCSIALYKMKYFRSAPKSGRCSYPAAEGCFAPIVPGVANETANPSATGEVYFRLAEIFP